MPTPSLLIVPARFKSGKLYSQIPTSGAGDFTVTRATSATRVNASGLIESVASGIPRLDYFASGGTAGCPALLVEPAATNLCLQSAAIQTSPWSGLIGGTGVAPTITANNAVAPDGATTATKILLDRGVGTASSDFSIWDQTITVTAVAHTFSVWLKSATGVNQIVQLRVNSAPSTTITITTDWQKFTIVNTPSAGSRRYGFDLRGNTAGAGQTAEFYAWGAQLETGSVATSYIPTTAGTGSRSADVVSVSGAVSGSIGQTEGTIYAEVDVRNFTNSARVIALSDGTGANAINLQILNPDRIRVTVNRLSIDQADFSAVMPAGVNKLALGYAQNNIALYLNGTSVGTDTSCNIPATNKVDLGSLNGNTFLNDRIRAAAIYTTRLTNAELATLTTP